MLKQRRGGCLRHLQGNNARDGVTRIASSFLLCYFSHILNRETFSSSSLHQCHHADKGQQWKTFCLCLWDIMGLAVRLHQCQCHWWPKTFCLIDNEPSLVISLQRHWWHWWSLMAENVLSLFKTCEKQIKSTEAWGERLHFEYYDMILRHRWG